VLPAGRPGSGPERGPDAGRECPETPDPEDDGEFDDGEPVPGFGALEPDEPLLGLPGAVEDPVSTWTPTLIGATTAGGVVIAGTVIEGVATSGTETPGTETPGREIPGREIPGIEMDWRVTARTGARDIRAAGTAATAVALAAPASTARGTMSAAVRRPARATSLSSALSGRRLTSRRAF
jgi:hypothetical protein